jgi:hypothetical protein
MAEENPKTKDFAPSDAPARRSTDSSASDSTHVEPIKTQPIRREPTHDGVDVVNLPTRTLSNDAHLEEYTKETIDGQILREVRSRATGKTERYELVTWKVDDPENPKNWSKAYKWWCTMCVALTCFVVAFNSAVITANLEGVAEEFNVSEEVALLTITLFVIGMSYAIVVPSCTNSV